MARNFFKIGETVFHRSTGVVRTVLDVMPVVTNNPALVANGYRGIAYRLSDMPNDVLVPEVNIAKCYEPGMNFEVLMDSLRRGETPFKEGHA